MKNGEGYWYWWEDINAAEESHEVLLDSVIKEAGITKKVWLQESSTLQIFIWGGVEDMSEDVKAINANDDEEITLLNGCMCIFNVETGDKIVANVTS